MSEKPGGDVAGEVIAPGVGRMLAEARAARDWSVAQVAEKLKLTSRQVEALEAEDLSRLPTAVFVRGFIRNYARLLEIPPETLLANTQAVTEPTETITAPSEELRFGVSPMRRWLVLPLLAVVLFMLLVALLYTWLSQGEEAYVPNAPPGLPGEGRAGQTGEIAPLLPTIPPAAPAAPAAEATATGPVADVPAAVDTAPASVSPAPAQPAPAPAVPPAPPTPAVKPAAGAALPPAGGNAPPVARPAPAAGSVPAVPAAAVPAAAGAIVQFVAREDAWIEVVSGDNQRFNRLLRAGEQLALRGTPPFRLVVGNAANVQVAYRGKAVDLAPHIGDKVARVTLE